MYNILICDDEKDIVSALKIYLNTGEYKLFTAYNGAEAVEIVSNNEIHLILMDIMMPVMDGIEAMKEIRKFSNTPVILLSAKSEDIDKILAVLKKLKELKFDEIEFNREIDFTQEEQYVYTWFADNIEITYMDNMVIIPDYSSGYVKYKSNDSSYKITIGSFRGYYKILLNNLVFDSNRLPDNSQKEDLFENIMALRNEKTDEITAVRNSVDIGVAIQDLYNMFNIVSLKIDQIDDIDKKKELKELLVSIKETIEKMQAISKEYDKTIASENPTISEAFLNEQKDEFVRRREDNKLHIW